jgi:hypothetical protein
MMEHPAISLTSPHLFAERNRLLDLIVQIRQTGTIAPAYSWLTESSETKGNRTYIYIRLIQEIPDKKKTSQSLGKPGSGKHRDWQEAIARREAITELEQQLKLLEGLSDRQATTAKMIAQSLAF